MFELKDVKYKNILDIEHTVFPKGEISAILGKSGSGKTTALRLLNKMNSPDSGNIYFNDKDIKDMDALELRRNVQMLSQFPIVYDGNLRDNLNLGLKFMNESPKSDEVLNEKLEIVKLNKDLDGDCNKYSGGEKQRLCIARILVSDPDIFLFDEPSSSLDKDTEEVVLKNIFKYIRDTGKTLIFVTHSQDMAYKYADRIYRIEDKDLKEVSNGR